MTLPARKMSALGQKQTCAARQPMSALPPIADICIALVHVCFCQKRTSVCVASMFALEVKRTSLDFSVVRLRSAQALTLWRIIVVAIPRAYCPVNSSLAAGPAPDPSTRQQRRLVRLR